MQVLDGVKAIILDKDGVFVDFDKLWLRVIAYRAQLIAEIATDNWEAFNIVRTACIKAMGVDEDDESIDPNSPSSMPVDMVMFALTTAAYISINGIDPEFTWKNAEALIDRAMAETKSQLNFIDMAEEVPGSVAKIKELAATYETLAVFTSDTKSNADETLAKFELVDAIKMVKGGARKTSELYAQLCQELGYKPEETVFVSDAPHDIRIGKEAGAKTIAVLSGVASRQEDYEGFADVIIPSIVEMEIAAKA